MYKKITTTKTKLRETHQVNAKELLEYRLGDTPNAEKMTIT
jgi:hypothetical protein